METIIYNNIIPFEGFKAINLFGIIFAREILNKVDINHEKIHSKQMKDFLYIFYYPIYIIEWIIRLFQYGNKAYRNISFEREAYANQNDFNYKHTFKNYLKYIWY